ncbi:MAG: hypothetical protein ABIE74_01600 [Pseudomonadota bacterium]
MFIKFPQLKYFRGSLHNHDNAPPIDIRTGLENGITGPVDSFFPLPNALQNLSQKLIADF